MNNEKMALKSKNLKISLIFLIFILIYSSINNTRQGIRPVSY